MKIRQDFVLRKIANEYVLIPTGSAALEFGSLISTNEVGYFIWEQLRAEQTLESLTEAVEKEYDVDSQTARNDIEAFIECLKQHQLLVE